MTDFLKKLLNKAKKEYPEIYNIFNSNDDNKSPLDYDELLNDNIFENDAFENDAFDNDAFDNDESDYNVNENIFENEIEYEKEDSDIESDLSSVFSDLFGSMEDPDLETCDFSNENTCGVTSECDESNEINGRKEALNRVFRDPADIEMAKETRKKANAIIRHNLNARKFLWGSQDLIEQAGDYIVDHSNDGIDEICSYLESCSIRYDRSKFEEEFASFIRKSILIIVEREKINEYIFLDRIDGDEIIKRLVDMESCSHNKKYKKPGFYLRLNRDLIDRHGKYVQSDLFVTIYPDEQFIDWESPEVKEYILYQFNEKYGFDLYYDQIDRANFDVSILN